MIFLNIKTSIFTKEIQSKNCRSESHSTVFDFATPWDSLSQSMEFSKPECQSGQPFPSPGDLPNSGTELRSPAQQADSVPAEPQGKPKNIGVGSLSLLQGLFLTQESTPGFLHCRWILYQLSYQGSPNCRRNYGIRKFSFCVSQCNNSFR